MLSEIGRGKLNDYSIKKFPESAPLVKDLRIQLRLENLNVSKRIRDLQAANIDVKNFSDHDGKGLPPPPPSPPVSWLSFDPNFLPYNLKTNEPKLETKDPTNSVIENLFK